MFLNSSVNIQAPRLRTPERTSADDTLQKMYTEVVSIMSLAIVMASIIGMSNITAFIDSLLLTHLSGQKIVKHKQVVVPIINNPADLYRSIRILFNDE